MQDKVTIVTLTYKNFANIEKTIESVLSQDYPNLEYIVSDDGSSDFPYDFIVNHIENNKKDNLTNYSILRSQENVGTVRNINKAYKQASGKYIIPLSGDDVFYDTNVVSQIVSWLDKNNYDLGVTSRVVCDRNDNLLYFLPRKKDIYRIRNLKTCELQHKAFITEEFYDMASGSVLALKKSFIDSWGYFDEKYILWEDGPFFTKYTQKNLIPTNYDIISIKYHLGGVSNAGPNPKMRKDRILYNQTDRVEKYIEYDKSTRNKIDYINTRYVATTKTDILKTYLKYPLAFISRLFYKCRL